MCGRGIKIPVKMVKEGICGVREIEVQHSAKATMTECRRTYSLLLSAFRRGHNGFRAF